VIGEFINNLGKTYAICLCCDDFYDIDEIEDVYPGYCSYSCADNEREGSCYCNATSHPPCSWCECGIDADHDIIGGLNDIFLWSFSMSLKSKGSERC